MIYESVTCDSVTAWITAVEQQQLVRCWRGFLEANIPAATCIQRFTVKITFTASCVV